MNEVMIVPVMLDCLPDSSIKMPFDVAKAMRLAYARTKIDLDPINDIICLKDMVRNMGGDDYRNTGDRYCPTTARVFDLAACVTIDDLAGLPNHELADEQIYGNDEYIAALLDELINDCGDNILSYVFGKHLDDIGGGSEEHNEVYYILEEILIAAAHCIADNTDILPMLDLFRVNCDNGSACKVLWLDEFAIVSIDTYGSVSDVLETIRNQFR